MEDGRLPTPDKKRRLDNGLVLRPLAYELMVYPCCVLPNSLLSNVYNVNLLQSAQIFTDNIDRYGTQFRRQPVTNLADRPSAVHEIERLINVLPTAAMCSRVFG